jgi:hypothetical protein
MTKRIWHTKSTRQEKVLWLLKHQNMWEGWKDKGDPRQRDIFDAMVRDGLLSEKTYWKDPNFTSLIYEARRVRRMQ